MLKVQAKCFFKGPAAKGRANSKYFQILIQMCLEYLFNLFSPNVLIKLLQMRLKSQNAKKPCAGAGEMALLEHGLSSFGR